MVNDFYSEIEEPIRDLVKYLRDNGINTICSCGDDMTIQAEMSPDGWLGVLHKLVFNYLTEHDIEPNYVIEARIEVCNSKLWRCWGNIKIMKDSQGKSSQYKGFWS